MIRMGFDKSRANSFPRRLPGTACADLGKLIYDQLPPGVLEDIQRKNPVDPVTKRRKRKHYDWLTEDVGNPHVDKQIAAVTTLLRATPNGQWKFFELLFNQAFFHQFSRTCSCQKKSSDRRWHRQMNRKS